EMIVRLHIAPQIGKHSLARIGPQHLQALYADRLAAGLSPQTVRKIHAVIHRALQQALLWNLVPRNVADLVMPVRVQRYEMRTLDQNQAQALLAAAAGDRLEAVYVLALTTGMR